MTLGGPPWFTPGYWSVWRQRHASYRGRSPRCGHRRASVPPQDGNSLPDHRPGTVIAGVIEQGTLHMGDELELARTAEDGRTQSRLTRCTGISGISATGHDPTLGAPVGVIVSGLAPHDVQPGGRLQHRWSRLATAASVTLKRANRNADEAAPAGPGKSSQVLRWRPNGSSQARARIQHSLEA